MLAMAEITFSAAVYKVSTLADGGIRVTLDMPTTETRQMAMLAECQLSGIPLILTAVADEDKNDPKRTKRAPF